MWFRPGHNNNNSATNSSEKVSTTTEPIVDKFDKFRVSSFKRRMRNVGRKSQTPEKSSTPPPVIVEDDVIPPKIPEETKSIQDEVDCVVTKLDVGRLKVKAKTDLPTRKITTKPIIFEKEKTLLTDRKFKNNRIVKSSSKSKISDLDNLKTGRNNRKITIDTTKLVNDCEENTENNGNIPVTTTNTSGIPVPVNKKHHIRANSTLNLNALYKLVSTSNGKKNLTSEDFDRIRRKSLTEAAASAAAVVISKPVQKTSITSMKYADDDGVATYSEVDDSNNVVLVKHDTKTDSCDSLNFNTINNNCDDEKTITENCDENLIKNKNEENTDEKLDIIVNCNNKLGDEYYSCDEDDENEEETCEEDGKSNDKKKSKTHKSSPSLTSRVAAKIYETTNSYKNRKSKSPKKRKNSRRSEFYKQISVDRLHSASVVRHPSDRRPDLANSSISSSSVGTQSHNTSELQTSQSLDTDTNALDAEQDSKTRDNRSKSKSAPVSVNRSESYKDRLTQKRLRSNRRKTSDPSLTKTNDEQQSELGLSNANYTASSSSSLSSGGSLESPSTSLEQVGGGGSTGGTPIGYNQHHHHHSSHHQQHHSHHHGGTATPTGPMTTATGTVLTPRLWVDSDDEDNINEVDWSSNIQAEILASLSDTEKKRQEIINEIFQTERSHVRTLRVLEGIFYRPLKETGVLPSDHLQLLFPPALLSLKELHLTFEQQLKARRIEHNHIVKNVGDLLITMFEGISGDELRDNAMQFCARQQIALEALKEKRRKDENLQRFLTKAESHKACRRLQLKDLLPTVLQRLTKYPLLFENLLKITIRVNPDDKGEADTIQRALDSSKKILVDVNQAVKFSEDTHKLQTIQRKLDKSSFDKESSNEFKNLDLTQYKLVHDGQLTMKKNPGVQLHGLLFENMMVLVQKQDDKYFLKYFPNVAAGTNENNKLISPITHFDQQTFVRQSAVDKNTFFVIITKTSQMLELRAPSSSECKTWFKHISEAAEQYKPRSKNNQDVVEDPASATLPHSNTKESLEGTPERTTMPTTIQTTERISTPLHNNGSIGGGTNNLSGLQQSGQQKQLNNLVNNNNSIIGGEKINRDDCGNNNDEQSQNIDKLSHDSGISNVLSTDQHQQQHSDRRDSIYSNNSNNTRTLMQHCPLLEPSEIQISISPAHTAEPIVTPTEQLRRLDEKIRNDLAEKQKIICDMFRVPNEHFMDIVDIVGQPEAPKNSSDICLAAFAQVQSLTEVLTEYMKCTPEQEISAVSTAVCDQCHHTNNHQRRLSTLSLTPDGTGGGNSIGNGGLRSLSPLQSSIASTNTGTTIIQKQDNFDEITATSPITTTAVESISNSGKLNNLNIEKSNELMDEPIIHEDDDGYCEIDELRLPSVQTTNSSLGYKQIGNTSGSSSNNNCGGNGIAVPNSRNNNNSNNNNNQSSSPPELLKRQSTISADSIPEESEQDITQDEETTNSISKSLNSCSNSKGKDDRDDSKDSNEQEQNQINKEGSNKISSEDDSLNSEHIEINDTYDTTVSVNKIASISNLVYHESNPFSEGDGGCSSINDILHLCGPNRLAHVNTLEPSIPCHIVNGFVTALNTQISLLLPKINERDLERERLRKENQHLRELLNAMHERKRVEDEKETPENVAKSTEISSSSADSESLVPPVLTAAQQPE